MDGSVALPEGFQLDQAPAAQGNSLPEGFQLDSQPAQQETLQDAPIVQAPPSNQIAPPIDLRGAIKDRLAQRENGLALKSAGSAAAGINSIAPALAGLPMDTIQNIINLGITAYGGTKALMGADPTTLPQADVGPLPWGSQDIKEKVSGVVGSDPFAPSDDSALQQNIHMGSSIMGAGLMSPTTGVKQTASNIAAMAPAAAGAIGMKETFPNQPLAPMAGMMLGGQVKPAYQTAKASAMKPKEAFLKARELGYRVPPVSAKPTATQQTIQGAAGNVPLKQKASIYNQKVTNKIIKKDLGYPKDTPLSSEGLDAIRADAGKVYSKISKVGKIKVDDAFTKDLSKISSKGSVLAKEIPGLAKKDVDKLVSGFNRKEYSSGALVEAIKQLRADSKTGFKSQDPSTVAMAKAQGKVANAIEGVMERNLAQTNPKLLPEFKAARQRIAKTYTVEKALKGENVDAVALGRELDKGKPLNGKIKEVAQFGQNFKGSAHHSPPQDTGFRPADSLPGVVTAISTGNPLWLIGMAARPAARAVMLSKPYQSKLAKVYPKQIKDIQKLPADAQVTAITSLLEQVRSQAAQDKQQEAKQK